MAGIDDNGKPVIYGVSHRDGITPVRIRFTASRHMLTDPKTPILFDPSIVPQDKTSQPLAKATSSSDDTTIMPWVVNEDTGAVLISK